MKALQLFDDEALERSRSLSADEIILFLEQFRQLHTRTSSESQLISVRVPKPLLHVFKAQCRKHGVRYQTQIKALMHAWVHAD